MQSILPPDICLSGAPSFSLSLCFFSHFRKKAKLNTNSLSALLVHTPPVSQQRPSKIV